MEKAWNIEIEEHTDTDRSHLYTVYGSKASPIDSVAVDTVKIGRLGPAGVTFEAGTTVISFSQGTPHEIVLKTKEGVGDTEHTTAKINIGEF